MTKHYTELTGATGTKVQFGAPEHDADVLFSKAAPQVRIGLGLYTLKSISTLGFAIYVKDAIEIRNDDDAVDIAFEQQGKVLLRARILPSLVADDGLIQCRFFDRALDIGKLTHDNAAAVASARVSQKSLKPDTVPGEYKIFCADLLDMLVTSRRQIAEDIAPFEAELTVDERHALDSEMEQAISGYWRDIRLRGNDLVLPYKNDDTMRKKLKRYTENVVTGELCTSPLLKRCYTKPMGYPGDYQIMNSFYDYRAQGDDAYTRLVDLMGLIAGKPVAARMRRLTEELLAMTDNAPNQEHFHVMSVGAGPAREFKRFFANGYGQDKGFSITLVDPEVQALDFAIKSIYGSVQTGLSSVMVSGMNTSFVEMLRPHSTFRHLPAQDMIYSAGLTDYLNTKLTRSLIKKLYEHIKPGGTVMIGNVNDTPDGMYWSAEYALDWTMYFRNQAEMEEIADGMPGIVDLSLDESGSYYLLKLTKPA